MKFFFTLFMILGVLFQMTSFAQNTITITGDFKKNVVVINNTTFSKNSTLEEYEKVLGKADRVEKIGGKDKIVAYDKAGISLSLKANTNLVQEIYITYIYDGDKKVAKETFAGKLSINGNEVTNTTTAEQIGKFANLNLVMAMKGLYMGKGKALHLVAYYPETTLGQFAFSFEN